MRGKDEASRFDQKNHMYYQGEWNPAYSQLSREHKYMALKHKLAEGNPGYTILDYALHQGAQSVLKSLAINMNRANVGGNTWEDKRTVPASWSVDRVTAERSIKKAAFLYGADDVGVCRLNRSRIYSHYFDSEKKQSFPIHFSDEEGYASHTTPGMAEDRSLVIPESLTSVIVLIVEMDFAAIATAPALPQVSATAAAYSKLASTVLSVTEFIRSLGYLAIPSLNCTGANIPLAIDAGLGKMGRHGLLIHPRFGPRCRIAKVVTNLPLPEGRTANDYLEDFCAKCNRCVNHCPAKAISGGEISRQPLGEFSGSGYDRWPVNYAKCREYWVKSGTNCGTCVAVCSLNRNNQSQLITPENYWQSELD